MRKTGIGCDEKLLKCFNRKKQRKENGFHRLKTVM